MPASLLPNAKQYFPDINGEPLVGGLVNFYEVGTLVPKDTWQDAGQTILNTNPVVLDSRGQAIIYGTGAYRQILEDAQGNLIWDQTISGYQESVFGPQATIASNTTTDLGSVSSNNILVTGTTTINSFGASASLANPVYLIQFAGILSLTYNATSMVLPGGADITTAENDSALVEFTDVAGYWRMIAYFSGLQGALGTAATKNIGTSGATVPLLSNNNTWSGSQQFEKQTWSPEVNLAVVSGNVTPDFSQGNHFSIVTGSSFTLNPPFNIQLGQNGVFRVEQSAAGLTISWGTGYKAPGGIGAVNLTGASGAVDYFAYYVHASLELIITPILNIS